MNEKKINLISADECTPTREELIELLEKQKYARFRSLTENVPSVDIARLIEDMPEEYRARFFRLLTKKQASEAFVEMDREFKEELINSFGDKELSEMLAELYIDDTVDIIEEMPATVVKRILRGCDAESRKEINKLLRYPKDTAGTIMTTEYVRFLSDMTVNEALSHIRRVAQDKETVYSCFVTDRERKLLGVITAKRLLVSAGDAVLSDIMEENVIFAHTLDDREEVAAKFNKYGFIALPVVDNETRLVGIVTVDDAIEVMAEETEQDFAKMAAITPSEEPYLRNSVASLFKSRIPWLLLLMISATLSSTILARFEAALPTVLILFVPMLMDTGGNSGAQSSVTVIRGLSVGELTPRDVPLIVIKEAIVGVMCGTVLGAVAFLKVILVDRLLASNPEVTVSVALAVAIALMLTVIIAKLIGATLPPLAKLLHLDPAVMASPLITTVVDALSLVLYFLISSAILGL